MPQHTRKPRSKYKVGNIVTLARWGVIGSETGEVVSVHPSYYETNNGLLTMYRYIVQMDNARDAFGASTRFLWESEMKLAVVSVKKAA